MNLFLVFIFFALQFRNLLMNFKCINAISVFCAACEYVYCKRMDLADVRFKLWRKEEQFLMSVNLLYLFIYLFFENESCKISFSCEFSKSLLTI